MKCAGAYMHLKWETIYCGNAMSNVTELVKKYDNICDECETKAKADEPNKDKCMPVCEDDHDHDHRRRLGDDHDHDDECPHSHTAMYVGIFLVVVVIGVVAGMFFTKKGCFSEDGKPANSG